MVYSSFFSCFLMPKLPFSFWCTLSLMAGIAAGYSQMALPFLFFLCLLSQAPHKKILCLVFALGSLAYLQKVSPKLPSELLEKAHIKATIIDKSFIDNPFWKHRTRLHVNALKMPFGWHFCDFEIYLYSPKRLQAWTRDAVEIGPIDIKQTSDHDFYLYLCRENIAGTSFSKKPFCKTAQRPKNSFLNWLFWQRELLQIKLRKKMSRPTFSLFSSIFFGNKQSVKNELEQNKNYFKYWGILHHLARSGLHLIIFVMVWHFILGFLPINFTIKHMLTLLIMITYLLLSWSSLSFVRALFLYLFYKYATLQNQSLHPVHAVSIASFVILLHNPTHLFFLDFQLSFLISFCLVWIAHVYHLRRTNTNKSIAA